MIPSQTLWYSFGERDDYDRHCRFPGGTEDDLDDFIYGLQVESTRNPQMNYSYVDSNMSRHYCVVAIYRADQLPTVEDI